jgi:NADH-quinone oxidoreductase subunit B
MAVDEKDLPYTHPLYDFIERVPGLDIVTTTLDKALNWGTRNSLWIFPMATSCCGIEFMATMASRIDIDRMGSFVRGTPRQSDVMVVAGTITVKMAPRVKRLWDQMPEPKYCVAMGSCAISGDFYRDIYSVIPGIDTAIPVDVYIPGCPPNPEALMAGMIRLREKVALKKAGLTVPVEPRPQPGMIQPRVGRICHVGRDARIDQAQLDQAMSLHLIEPPALFEEYAEKDRLKAEAIAQAEAEAKAAKLAAVKAARAKAAKVKADAAKAKAEAEAAAEAPKEDA